jgi:hypothetical protein
MPYSITGFQYGSDHRTEICRVETNPEAVVQALSDKTIKVKGQYGNRPSSVSKYTDIQVTEVDK